MGILPGTQNRINGTNGNDNLVGTLLDDLIVAGAGLDSVDGGPAGNDYLDGGAGSDFLIGGIGEDWLIGGLGNDLLTGGGGADQFRFHGRDVVGSTTDTITDLKFEEGDLLALANYPAGFFQGEDIPGQLDVVDTGEGAGSGARVSGYPGLVAVVAATPALTAIREGQTDNLLLIADQGNGNIQIIKIVGGWPIYQGLINQGPSAGDNEAAVAEDATVTGNLLDNDADPNAGDMIAVSGVAADGGPAQAVPGSIASTYGTLDLQADGSYSYTADSAAAQALKAGQIATETFTYTIVDSFGVSATATLTIEVTGTNDGPVAAALTGSTSEDGPAIGFTPSFTDVDAGDTHAISLDLTGTLGTVTQASDGSFSYDPNGQFESLAFGQSATDTFSYTVTDASGATSTRTVTVSILGRNDAPVAQALAAAANENGPAVTVAPAFSDVDAGDTTSVAIGTAGTLGLVSQNADGSFRYDPNGKFEALRAGQTATDSFTYTITDLQGATSTATVTVTVTGQNDGPVANNVATSAQENGGPVAISPNFTDADAGDTHSFAVGTAGTVGKVTVNGGTFSYDANGKFESLGVGETATDSFTYTVTDAFGAADTKTVTVTIVGQNDLASTRTDIAGVEKNGSINVAAAKGVLANDTDIDGDALAVAAVNGLAANLGKGIAGKFGTLTMKADGSYSYVANTSPGALPAKGVAQDVFTYTVSDGQGGTVVEKLTVTVYQKGQTYKGGTDGADSFIGGNGADVLNGGNGNDILSGGNGADILIGGTGNDLLTGGLGNDTFVFGGAFGADKVSDFAKGDVIQLAKSEFTSFAALAGAIQKIGADTVIDLGNGNQITLTGFSGTLGASDFLFL